LPCLIAVFILKLEADGYLRHVIQGLMRSYDVEGEKTVDNGMNDEMNAWTAERKPRNRIVRRKESRKKSEQNVALAFPFPK
jgi:hypothetical protein